MIEWKPVQGRKQQKLMIYDGKGHRCDAGWISNEGAKELERFMEKCIEPAERVKWALAKKAGL